MTHVDHTLEAAPSLSSAILRTTIGEAVEKLQLKVLVSPEPVRIVVPA
jgi:hypothetical protein